MKLPFVRTVRGRLLLLALLVEALMLFLLVSNSLRLLRDNMESQARSNSEQLAPVLQAALVAPLAQADYATVQAVLDESHATRSILYLAVVDAKGKIVASSGLSQNQPLPEPTREFSLDQIQTPPRFDVARPIEQYGQRLGLLHFGLDLTQIVEARNSLAVQGLFISIGELLLSTGLLTFIGLMITRRLSVLTQASTEVAKGNLTPPPVPEGNDDVGQLGAAFNVMSRTVAERVTQLTAAREAADAANIAKSSFLATMSHEIRTPMNGILGMAQLLQMPGLDESERIEFARVILNSGQTLMTLLNDILDLSRVEAGRLELQCLPLAPGEVLDEIAGLFGDIATAKGLHFEAVWHGPEQAGYQADPTRLRQMLSNLVNNAIKFTASGFVRIEARQIETGDQQATLEFSVTDSGIGIPPDKIGLLFQPFSQLDGSITREYGGSGLGLSIVNQLAELMQGATGVESRLGEGSRFWFRIQCDRLQPDEAWCQRPHSKPLMTAGSAPDSDESGHLLIVEDNSTNRQVIEGLLKKIGLSCHSVENGQEAVERVCSGSLAHPLPRLILMDCQMPVMDGYTATASIRQWENEHDLPRLPIVALTAGAFEEDRERCLAVGMDDFLTKPVNYPELHAVIAKWLVPVKP